MDQHRHSRARARGNHSWTSASCYSRAWGHCWARGHSRTWGHPRAWGYSKRRSHHRRANSSRNLTEWRGGHRRSRIRGCSSQWNLGFWKNFLRRKVYWARRIDYLRTDKDFFRRTRILGRIEDWVRWWGKCIGIWWLKREWQARWKRWWDQRWGRNLGWTNYYGKIESQWWGWRHISPLHDHLHRSNDHCNINCYTCHLSITIQTRFILPQVRWTMISGFRGPLP